MQLAVIPAIEEAPAAALLPAEGMVAVQGEKDTAAHAAHAQHGVVVVGSDIEVKRCHVDLSFNPKSHSGCWLTGWLAVSMVAVSKASGCSCSSVIGYSTVSGPKSATRKAVCFQAPVSLNRRTFLADRHSLMPERDRHGRHELVGRAESALGQGDDRVQVVFLHAHGRIAQLFQA